MAWPIWGNYCGPGWTGGKPVVEGEISNYGIDPIDALDAQCQTHDAAYGQADIALKAGDMASYWGQILAADRALLTGLKSLLDSLDHNVNAANYDMFRMAEGVQAAFILKVKFVDEGNLANSPISAQAAQEIDEFLWSQFPIAESLVKGFTTLPNIDVQCNRDFTAARNWTQPRDPLVLDLDGDGIEAVGINPAAPILFDHDGDGTKNATGWIKADDGIVVFDRNGNGLIDSGRELFGDNTILQNGTKAGQTAANGYEALADLDANRDGALKSGDAAYDQLRVWQDTNQDGISQANELHTLSELGVASIQVLGEASNIDLGNGNTQPWSGSFTRSDGTSGASGVAEVTGSLLLASNSFYREFTDDPVVTAAAAALPQMGGSGWVRDLREAMSLDTAAATDLRVKLESFSAATTRDAQMALLDEVIAAWGNTATRVPGAADTSLAEYDRMFQLSHTDGDWREDFEAAFGAALDAKGVDWRATINASGSGTATWSMLVDAGIIKGFRETTEGNIQMHMVYTASQSALDVFIAGNPTLGNQVRALEAFNGSTVLDRFVTPSSWNDLTGVTGYMVSLQTPVVNLLNQAYEALKESVYASLVVQTRLQPYLDRIELVIDETGIHFDTTALSTMIDASLQTDLRNGAIELVELNLFTQSTLHATGYDGVSRLRAVMAGLPTDSALRTELMNLGVHSTSGRSGAAGDVFLGGNDSEYFWAGAGNDVLDAGSGDDTLGGEEGDDFLSGGEGWDALSGGDENDVLEGGAGNDYLSGDDGDDLLDGGSGSDRLQGGDGADTYLFGFGSGRDEISNQDSDAFSTKQDTILFGKGISSSDVTITRSRNTLVLSINGTADVLQVNGYFDRDGGSSNAVENIRFQDGTSWDIATVKEMALISTEGNDNLTGYETDDQIDGGDGRDHLVGGAGNDILNGDEGSDSLDGADGNDVLSGGDGVDYLEGGEGNDLLDGGLGNDYMVGGGGNDTFNFGYDSGRDTVYSYMSTDDADVDIDIVQLGLDITEDDIRVVHSGDDLLIKINGTEDQLSMQYALGDEFHNRMDGIKFSDGTHWDVETIKRKVLESTSGNDLLKGFSKDENFSGGSGNDVLDGQGGNDVLDGGSGNDEVAGGEGDDILLGGEGHDRIIGGNGDDVLDGGAGDDFMHGGVGADIYVFDRGYGQDYIRSADGYATDRKPDILRFGANIAPSDLIIRRIDFNGISGGNNLQIEIQDTGDSVVLEDYFANDEVSSSALEIIQFADGSIWDAATVRAKLLKSTSESDVIWGFSSDDTINGGDGSDYIFGKAGNDALDGQDGDDRLQGGRGSDFIVGGDGNDTLIGDDEDDVLIGGAGEDVLSGGSGNDLLNGGIGNDSYVFGKGFGQDVIEPDGEAEVDKRNTLYVAVNSSEVSLFREGTSLVVSINESADKLTINAFFESESPGNPRNPVQEIYFTQDQVLWNFANIAALLSATPDVIVGSASDDVLTGTSRSETIHGHGGNDTVSGNDGDDILLGGNGDDRLDGGAGSDILEGAAGNDELTGGAGDDVYRFGPGAGHDVITQYEDYTGSSSLDRILFTGGIRPADLVVERIGMDLVFKYSNGSDQVTVSRWFENPVFQVDLIEFEDGVVWNAGELTAASLVINGTSGNDELIGSELNDTLNGFAGSDRLFGGRGDDILNGGNGNDELFGGYGANILYGGDGNDRLQSAGDWYGHSSNAMYGGAGDDVLQAQGFYTSGNYFEGGTGNDMLYGGYWDDIYQFNLGDGQDVISDYGDASSTDHIVFGLDIDPADVKLFRIDNDLLLKHVNGTEQIKVKNWFSSANFQIESIDFSDASKWAPNFVAQNLAGYLHSPKVANEIPLLLIVQTKEFLYSIPENIFVDMDQGDQLTLSATQLDGSPLPSWLVFDPVKKTLSGTAPDTPTSELEFVYVHATDTSGASVTTSLTVAVSNFISGTAGADLLIGTASSDYFDGGAGADRMEGWLREDDYVVDNIGDVVIEVDEYSSIDTVRSSVTYTLPAYVEALFLTGSVAVDGTGNASNNFLEGNSASNVLSGGAGSDTYYFGRNGGQDVVIDHEDWEGEVDRLVFKPDIAPSEVQASRIGDDLVLNVSASTDQLTLQNYFLINGGGLIERIEFAADPATIWKQADVLERLGSVQAPVLTSPLPDQTTEENASYSWTLPVSAFTTADTATVLTYSAALSNGAALPDWLSFDAASLAFGGVPNNAAVGVLQIRLTAMDSHGNSVSDVFTLTVANTNDAPAVLMAMTELSGTVDEPWTYTVPADVFTDIDAGDSLRYSATRADGSALPAWLSFDPATRSFSGTPNAAQSGVVQIRLTATDLAGATAQTDFSLTVAFADGQVVVTGTADGDTLDGTAGSDILDGGLNEDWLKGGDGDDTFLVRGTETDADFSGYNLHQGDEGFDTILGSDRDDTILLRRFDWDGAVQGTVERIDGGAGFNTVRAGWEGGVMDLSRTELLNIARIEGGDGQDIITGTAGNDLIDGGRNDDWLKGGAGDDTFLVRGTEADSDFSGYNIHQGDAGFDTILGSDRDDTILLRRFEGEGAVERIDGGAGFNTVRAGWEGGLMDLSRTELVNIARIEGGDNQDIIIGTSGNDVIDAGRNDDAVLGGAGDDTFLVHGTEAPGDAHDFSGYNIYHGGDGFDTLLGSAGDDTILLRRYGGVASVERIDGGAGYNTVKAGWEGGVMDLSKTELVNIAKIEGGDNQDIVFGTAFDDTIETGAGADGLIGGAGNDRLAGGLGDDIYLFSRWSGADVVTENDGTAGNTDEAWFTEDIATDQLWFRQTGNDLEVSIIGTADKVTIGSWYLGEQHHLEKFKTSDGQVLLSSQVQNLVDAMAGFAPPAAGQTTLPDDYAVQLAPTIAANWT